MKKYSILMAWLIIVGFGMGCKKQQSLSPAFAQAYTRFMMIDAPGSSKLQFYMDGKVNVNGDSVIRNPDGTIYTPDPSLPTTTLVNYPSGGWTDNAPVNITGTYGNYQAPGNQYATFPNPTDRIPLAPVINGYNYYNWAALPAKNHQVSFYGVVSATLYGNQVFAKGSLFLDQQVTLEGGAVQTFLLVNQAPCKQYTTSGINEETGLPIYTVGETIDFYSNHFGLVSIKDHPERLPHFNDSSAYVRFTNITPTYLDQALNANTDAIDVYLAPMYGIKPDYFYLINQFYYRAIDSVGKEFPVGKGLARFASSVDAPFYEINLAAQMRNPNDTAVSPGKPRLPHYYRVLAYSAGHSAATGDQPIGQGDWLAVYNSFTALDYVYGNAVLGQKLDSWLLRSDGTSLHPSICTIPLAVGLNALPESISTNYMGFRSCIDYIPEGVNGVYYR